MTIRSGLSQERAAELREILLNKESACNIITGFATRCADNFNGTKLETLMHDVLPRQFAKNLDCILRHCESPIEQMFWESTLLSCLKNMVIVDVVGPPLGDYTQFSHDLNRNRCQLFKCYKFYQSLPDGARPKTFLNFLEMTGVEREELTHESAEFLAAEACVMFECGFLWYPKITLQPTFENFDGTRSARADAVISIPANEKVRIVIECDGFETHGDKDAFCRDRKRDRIFQSMGLTVRRYSGPEIHRDPMITSTDLVFFMIDSGYAPPKKTNWEKAAMRGFRPPTESCISGWRQRMAE